MYLSKSHKAYFNAAKAISETSDFQRVHIGCVAVYSHRIISSGCNTCKSNPIQKKYNAYRFDVNNGNHMMHAEVQCLLPLIGRKDIDFSRVSLYIYREHKSGELALARPCESCSALIHDLGIRHVYYTSVSGYSHEEFLE